ncbi:MAG: DMT family transporter [Bacteroidales bacterium]|nr:DMT family transporter [Bacteroidales bacterium]
MWLLYAFVSAGLLGVYDVFKKMALNKNAVIPVLLLNTVFCSLIFLPLVVGSYLMPDVMNKTMFYIPIPNKEAHLYIILKSFIVLSSWMSAYFALKHLPITLASPIKASQPILTLIGAMFIFGERLNAYQWIGVLCSLVGFFMLSKSGKKEGITFSHNKWIWCIVFATITGAISGLYDKYLMQRLLLDRMIVQSWYNFYQVAMMGLVFLIIWWPKRKHNTPFQWRWSIPLISIFLSIADFVYFYALSNPDALISVVSLVRRSGVVVSFIAGWLFFKEKNIKQKSIDLILVLIAMIFLYFGTK